jgi:hypothetical protein
MWPLCDNIFFLISRDGPFKLSLVVKKHWNRKTRKIFFNPGEKDRTVLYFLANLFTYETSPKIFILF